MRSYAIYLTSSLPLPCVGQEILLCICKVHFDDLRCGHDRLIIAKSDGYVCIVYVGMTPSCPSICSRTEKKKKNLKKIGSVGFFRFVFLMPNRMVLCICLFVFFFVCVEFDSPSPFFNFYYYFFFVFPLLPLLIFFPSFLFLFFFFY